MKSRVRWLLAAGVVGVGVALWFRLSPPPVAQAPLTALARHRMVRINRPVPPPPPPAAAAPYSDAQLDAFFAAARQAEAMPDFLQRCLSYPDPPGLTWSRAVTAAYCHYRFDARVSVDDVRRLIRGKKVAELDRRLAAALHAQLTRAGQQGALDRTFNIDFWNSSPRMRALMDDWKRQAPRSAFALAASGTVYVAMADHARGHDVISRTPQSALETMHRLLGLARTDLDRAVALNPKLTPAYVGMLYTAMLDGGDAYAVNAARRGLAADPANYGIYERLLWMSQPRWGGSVDAMQHVIALAQRHVDQNPLLALLQPESNDSLDFVEDCDCSDKDEYDLYQQVFAQTPPLGLLENAGWAAEKRGHTTVAAIYRSELLRFDPRDLKQRESRAYNLAWIGQSEWAIAEGDALVALRPQDVNTYDVRGFAYELSGDIPRAISDYQQALCLSPKDTWTLTHLGDIYVHRIHDWDKGWSTATQLIQLAPDDPKGWLLRARIQQLQPRDGLARTRANFFARFANDPSKQEAVAEMRTIVPVWKPPK